MLAWAATYAIDGRGDELRVRGGVGATAGVGVVSLRSDSPLSFGIVSLEARIGAQFDRVFGAYADGALWLLNGVGLLPMARGFASFVLLDHVELALGPGLVTTPRAMFAPAFRITGLAGERNQRTGRRTGLAFGATLSPLFDGEPLPIWTLVAGVSYEAY